MPDITDIEDRKRAELADELTENFGVAVNLPASISKEFLSAALLHLVENKVAFAVLHTGRKIVIPYDPSGGEFVPHLWPDKKWRIGPPDREDSFFPDDD